jgi:hypothetical protein
MPLTLSSQSFRDGDYLSDAHILSKDCVWLASIFRTDPRKEIQPFATLERGPSNSAFSLP